WHGTLSLIPTAFHITILQKAGEPKQLWTVEGGDHLEAFTTYGASYRKRLVQFFTKAVETGSPPVR
ncbi:MAG: hypothetical protein WCO77_11550, partial [bacterium]